MTKAFNLVFVSPAACLAGIRGGVFQEQAFVLRSVAARLAAVPGMGVTIAGTIKMAGGAADGVNYVGTDFLRPGVGRFFRFPRSILRRILLPFERGIRLAGYRFSRRELAYLDDVNADAFVLSGLRDGYLAGQVALYADLTNRPLLVMLEGAHDVAETVYRDSSEMMPQGVTGGLCKEILARAALVVAQDDSTRQLAEIRLRRPVDVAPWLLVPPRRREPRSAPGTNVLWVGCSDRPGGTAALVDIAWALPDVQFLAVVSMGLFSLHRHTLSELPGNVRVIESVDQAGLDGFFANASLYLDTSRIGGMTAGMALAAAEGLPIVSLLNDPDGILSGGGGGAAAGDMIRLAQDIESLLSSPERWRRASDSILTWCRRNEETLTSRLVTLINVLKDRPNRRKS